MTELRMFCYQCEQTAKETGCTQMGVCGKQPDVTALQVLLLYLLKGLSLYANEARNFNMLDPKINIFTVKALFSTLTNVNFDPDRFIEIVKKSVTLKEETKKQQEFQKFLGAILMITNCLQKPLLMRI